MAIKRNVYLSSTDVNKALQQVKSIVQDNCQPLATETIMVTGALDRVTTSAIMARQSSPNHNASAMDGICVRAELTYGIDERHPLKLIKTQDFEYIDTGDVIKEPYNAVIMIEDVLEIDEQTVQISNAVFPWQNIRPVGEDIVAGEMILPAYSTIRPVDIGALLSGGITQVEVFAQPKVAILPTGSEIVSPGTKLQLGQIIDSNSHMFAAMIKKYGGQPNLEDPVVDDYQLIKQQVLQLAQKNNIVIIGAGSSAGREDFTAAVVEELGKVILHGVAIKPGKPVVIGLVNDCLIIGLPGYPVSAWIDAELFLQTAIATFLHQNVSAKPQITAKLSRRVVSSLQHLEYVRVKLGIVNDTIMATPLNRGAGVTMSLVRADGVMQIPKNTEGLESGSLIKVDLLRSLDTLYSTLVSVGSHDVLMDIITDLLPIAGYETVLSSTHIGSMGGILALRRGECHIAPIHLLDSTTGEYNISYIQKYFNSKMQLIKGVKRTQGFIVAKGNPKNITSITSLAQDDIVFVNRQKGAGTRLLLDYLLKQNKINSMHINGYEREMTTHMMVASAVSSGTADVGIGVKSAANVMGLDFIPISEEDYDFVISAEFRKDKRIADFMAVLQSTEFSKRLHALGGYRLANPGQIIEIN